MRKDPLDPLDLTLFLPMLRDSSGELLPAKLDVAHAPIPSAKELIQLAEQNRLSVSRRRDN